MPSCNHVILLDRRDLHVVEQCHPGEASALLTAGCGARFCFWFW
jgi:hypothetical protein